MTKQEELMKEVYDVMNVIVKKCKTKEEYLSVIGATLAFSKISYVKYMGNKESAYMFYSIADKLATEKD